MLQSNNVRAVEMIKKALDKYDLDDDEAFEQYLRIIGNSINELNDP